MHRLVLLVLIAGCTPRAKLSVEPMLDVSRLGGETTVDDHTIAAFSQPLPTLNQEEEDAFFVGNAFFNRTWVMAPSSTEGSDGLGPVFNATACSGCHFKDGRGEPPASPEEKMKTMLVRLSIPGTDAHGGPLDHPAYGGQLNDRAVLGVAPEGWASVSYTEVPGAYADGEAYSLRVPTYTLRDLAFGPADGILMSPRVAQQMVGLGLLEAIPEDAIRLLEDPDDLNGDGISGRANEVWDVAGETLTLGRFGWKANQPSLSQQVQGAFLGDIGVTSPLFQTENCTSVQTACLATQNGGVPEVDAQKVLRVTQYSSTLAVPSQRVSDAAVKGQGVFISTGCEACHTMTQVTRDDAPVAAMARQTIHPFTDLLLHDMGEGLADGRPDFLASGSEWRTPPLWGLGLVERINKHTTLLHDGRARNFAEAILWHGGEGQASRDKFVALAAEDRQALIAFLESL
jgi:CxxC motif-containing protein (DUF1111 family)